MLLELIICTLRVTVSDKIRIIKIHVPSKGTFTHWKKTHKFAYEL